MPFDRNTLYRETEGFEMPSDLQGVEYVPYDDAGKWQFKLVQELKAANYQLSADKLL